MVPQPASPPPRFELTDVVQNIGFRPFAFRPATELGFAGWLRERIEHVEPES